MPRAPSHPRALPPARLARPYRAARAALLDSGAPDTPGTRRAAIALTFRAAFTLLARDLTVPRTGLWSSHADTPALRAAHNALPPDIPDADPAELASDLEHLLCLAAADARRPRGVVYTPAPLVDHILDAALEPALRDALDANPARPDLAILALRVLDPSCGTGRILIPAARRLARALERHAHHAPNPRAARRDVYTRCILGVEADPLAADICRAALWLDAADPELPLESLSTRILHADALRGLTPAAARAAAVTTRADADAWTASFETRPTATPSREPAPPCHWLLDFPDVFAGPGPDRGFDLVLGNPPFLNQLRSDTAAARDDAARLRLTLDDVVRGYADTAAAFLALSLRLARPGARVALVQPQSLLAVQHAEPVRHDALARAALESLWTSDRPVFPAVDVLTCLPVLRLGAVTARVRRAVGPTFTPLPDADASDLPERPTWAHLIPREGHPPALPRRPARAARTLADLATATADFRDPYYAIRAHVVDHPDPLRSDPNLVPLLTTGLIDPAVSLWSRRPARLHKTTFNAPGLDLRSLAGDPDARRVLDPWLLARRVPKVLLPTQTRTLEPLADPLARWLPVTPIITLRPRPELADAPDALDLIAAVLTCPMASAVAAERYAGAALSPGAIKLSAAQTLELPAPPPGPELTAAAAAFRAASEAPDDDTRLARLRDSADASLRALALPASDRRALLEWWWGRLTPARPSRRAAPVAPPQTPDLAVRTLAPRKPQPR